MAAVIAGIRAAPDVGEDSQDDPSGVSGNLEFVRSDGLSNLALYDIDRQVLIVGRRVVALPLDAAQVLATALKDAPPAPTLQGFGVTVDGVTAWVHDVGACRLDRPFLRATPGATLTVSGDRATSVDFVMLAGPGIEVEGVEVPPVTDWQIDLPTTAGPVVVESIRFDTAINDCIVIQIGG